MLQVPHRRRARSRSALGLTLLLFLLLTPAAYSEPLTQPSLFRLQSDRNSGVAFVIYTRDRTLYLLTALSLLGNAHQPGGPPCTLDHGPATDSIHCEIYKVYDSLNVAVLRANVAALKGAFPPLILCDSTSLDTGSRLTLLTYAPGGGLQHTPALFLERSGFTDFQMKAASKAPAPLGSPLLDDTTQQVVGLIVKPPTPDSQPVLQLDMVLLALGTDDLFRGQLPHPVPSP